jgi:hypothetical protein
MRRREGGREGRGLLMVLMARQRRETSRSEDLLRLLLSVYVAAHTERERVE